MARTRTHKDLDVWKSAFNAAMMIFELTGCFPAEERYSMTDQIRRSSRSVAANIAEAWSRRRYRAAFIAKLNDAVSEAAETQTWLEFALHCKYLGEPEVQALDKQYDIIIAQLVTMGSKPDRWTFEKRGE